MDQYLIDYLRELEDECGFNDEKIMPDTRARTGDMPLHIAAINGNLRAIVLLLEGGAELNARGEGGMTPLHYAVQMEQVEAIKLLLEHDADHTVTNDFGDTPASTARIMKYPHIEALLPGEQDAPSNGG
jgi:ankyrin repeat protein